jgi:hypothetical protein
MTPRRRMTSNPPRNSRAGAETARESLAPKNAQRGALPVLRRRAAWPAFPTRDRDDSLRVTRRHSAAWSASAYYARKRISGICKHAPSGLQGNNQVKRAYATSAVRSQSFRGRTTRLLSKMKRTASHPCRISAFDPNRTEALDNSIRPASRVALLRRIVPAHQGLHALPAQDHNSSVQ